VELLDDPGSADLSAYVDFGAVRQAVHQVAVDDASQQGGKSVPTDAAQCHGPITQNHLLHAMGIHLRAQALAEVRVHLLGVGERIYML
jgi:NADH dehydrogenase [ubiquinone] 1 alpha subcomplex assembly factor 7